MRIKSVFVCVVIALLFVSCSAARQAVSDEMYAADGGFSKAAPAPMMAVEAPVAESASFESGWVGGASSTERMVIKNANISIVVLEPAKSMDTIAKMADAMGGWVVSSNLYKTTTKEGVEIPQASINIRVPADKLIQALEKIKAEVEDPKTDVLSENVSGQDVTSEYTDLTSRKNNLERAETQLQKILEAATETEDVLNVFNQLTQVRGEIEVIKGQMKYYEESSTFSAINVEIISKESIKPLTVAGWKPQGIARDAVQALVDTLKVLVNVLIYFIILVLPILIILFAVVKFCIWLFKLIFFRKRNKQPAKAPSTPEQENK
ncbi:MAG: hypothetical protein C0391_09435 [Anaerolinea sp.]|nr:hypothetical protein [Anaerolinea sp.]